MATPNHSGSSDITLSRGAADTEQLAGHATVSSDNASQIALKKMMVVPNENVTECC